MGQDNTVPRRINRVEGADGQVIVSGGPGVLETWQTPATVPSGLIAMWHGTIANIPAGYVICDGNNLTPNLLTRFVQGVATAATNPGATGGAATVTLGITEMPAHTHPGGYSGATAGAGGPPVGGTNTSQASAVVSQGGGSAHNNEPLFYDVAFLMKT